MHQKTFIIFDNAKSKFAVNVSPRDKNDVQMDETQHDANDGKSSEYMDSSMDVVQRSNATASNDEVGPSKPNKSKAKKVLRSSSCRMADDKNYTGTESLHVKHYN